MVDGELLLETSRFVVRRLTQQLPDGRSHSRAVIKHPGAVAVIPLVDEQHVCLIENYRLAVNQTLLELPAGTREPHEAPEVTAQRELREETGFRAESIEHVQHFYMSPGILDERMELYVARGLRAGEPALEKGELIENRILPWSEVMRLVDDGSIRDAKTLVGLMFFDRLRSNTAK